jgi:hypothetical protein
MRPRFLLMLTAGGLALAGLVFLALRARSGGSVAQGRASFAAEANSARYAASQAELRRASARRDRLRGDVDGLLKAESDLRAKLPAEPASAPAGAAGPAPDLSSRMTTLIRNMMLMEMDERLAELEKRLGLSPDQKARVRIALLKEVDAISDASTFDAADPEGAVDQARLRAELAQILTPAQLAGYDQYHDEEKVRGEAARLASAVGKLQTELDLSPEQVKAVEQAVGSDATLLQTLDVDMSGLKPGMTDAWIDQIRVDGRRLAALLQPTLGAGQMVKLEEHLKRREDEARELAGWLRVFAAEPPK